MNILVLSTTPPVSYQHGGCPRLYHFCRELSAAHELHFISVGVEQELLNEILANEAHDLFASTLALPKAPSPNWLGRQVHRLTFTPHFSEERRSPNFVQSVRKSVKEVFKREGADVIYARGVAAVQYLPKKTPAVIDLIDSLTLLFARNAQLERAWWKKAKLALEFQSIKKYEQQLARSGAPLVTISSHDRAALEVLDTNASVAVVPNGIDCEYFTPQKVSVRPNRIIFTGVMYYGPNEDAVQYFTQSVLPLIRKERADTEFWIVGKDPSPQVLELDKLEGVTVTGTVDDIRSYLAESAVFVSPLRYGTGMKNKLLAAMAMKKPIVATSLSIEGIDVNPGRDILLADTPELMAMRVLELLSDPDRIQSIGDAGHELVQRKYSWAQSTSALLPILQQAAEK